MAQKFIQKIVGAKGFRKGALRKKMGVKGSKTIKMSALDKKMAALHKKAKKGKLSSAELRTMREAVFAKNMMNLHK